MQDKPHRQVDSIIGALSRTFWALMFLAHAPALVSAWRYGLADGLKVELLGGSLFLSAAMLFFALKLWGVRWLRFRTDRRSFVAICLVVALIHLDCIHPGLRNAVVSKCTVVLATTTLVLAAPRIARKVRSAFARSVPSTKPQPGNGRAHETAWLDAFRPHCWVLAFRGLQLRAPPA